MAFIIIVPALRFKNGSYPSNFRNTLLTYYPFYIAYYGRHFYKNIHLVGNAS
jgi:hypothetical protein